MQLSERYHDFELISRETIKEVNSEALTFRHRCGARLIILDNEDDHKVFVMGFRTPPPNSTGVAHILEHSVLNGSKEYPVKEPFAELLKGSLQTFLNAITYPDRTLYPVASRNDQDFHNLMDVYLDALCNPLLSEETFLQEGWHFLIDTPESDLRYSGVVYNEMLGAYSDPERLLHREMEQLLFPDTIYGHCSGGEPEHITDLSYAEFQAFYRRYYHPANSLVYLYGTFDITDRLAHLNRYFQRYSYQEINAPITAQSRYHTARQEQAFYPITQAESKEKKVYALQSYLLDNSLEREKSLAFAMLAHILSDTPASPLKKALIDADLAEDVLNYGIDDSILEATYNIGLKGMNEADVPKMEACIETTLRRLVHEGIDPRAIDAALNTVEFSLREANFGSYSKGLIYGLAVQHAWCHRANPLCLLHYEDKLDKIKTAIRKGGYFEEMIERYLLNNPHRATLRLLPDPDYESRRLQQLTNRLTEIKKGFDEETIQGLIKKNQDLQQRQMTPDSPEALNSIPRLPLNCIEKEAECIHFEWLDTTPPRLSWSEQGTQGILYLQLRFDCAGLAERYLPYLPLFAQLCLESGTKKQDYVALTQDRSAFIPGGFRRVMKPLDVGRKR